MMDFLAAHYDQYVVAASIVIACFSSYVALDLARRVRSPEKFAALGWWAGGSLVMGTGIWSMHFVGMLAFNLPIQVGYSVLLTFASWTAAVVVSGIALGLASGGTLTARRLGGGAVAMGAGICAMHYTGMAAMDMVPGIQWNLWLVLASVVIALTASAAALILFFRLAHHDGAKGAVLRGIAAIVMGLAISGMHYTAMAAAQFPTGSVCLSIGALSGNRLGMLVALASIAMLICTWLVSAVDGWMRDKTANLAESLRLSNVQLQGANEELRRHAYVDSLTDLPNRVHFEAQLARALARCRRQGERPAGRSSNTVAVLFIDLDGFKPINDSFGHGAGDQVLKEVAQRLRLHARAYDTVARVGGDEFLLLMEDSADSTTCTSLARRLCETLREPIEVSSQRTVEISASIGIAAISDCGDGADSDKIISHADSAMYAAKRNGGNTFALFEAHMDMDAVLQMSLQSDLRHAAKRGELSLYYQPKVDGKIGQIHSVEALLRWHHPTRGLIGPGQFIPLAERFGFMAHIGEWVIDEACRQMREWSDRGVHIRVAINLSAQQLRDVHIVHRIEKAVTHHQIDASRLLCEVTESVAMEDVEAATKTIEGLAKIGVFLSIDDFGTGYCSLTYLRQLPARQLKIDRGFINDLETSKDARAIVDAVVRLAHALGLRVVAEGVETEGQRAILQELECDELQGFLFARPMPAEDLLDWMLADTQGRPADFAPSVIDETLRSPV